MDQEQSAQAVDVAVVGAGPAGLTAALALASKGLECRCFGQKYNPDPARPDTRTTALLQASVRLLQNLGIWKYCAHQATPLESIRIIDATDSALRAPEVTFDCQEIGGEPFGYNIINVDLVAALQSAADTVDNLECIETAGARIAGINETHAQIDLAEGNTVQARLVAAADGRNSACRSAAGITTRSWRYEQTAIACNFEHSEPHHNISNEFHHRAGPFTTVPLPGLASSLVWVQRPEDAEHHLQMSERDFCGELERRLHGVLGTVDAVGPRAAFPLSGLTVSRFAQNRTALVGEAAHVIPPIGAQGLNLGFRDAATLAEVVTSQAGSSEDPGADDVLTAYHEARRTDVLSRTAAVDLLNRSLLTDLLPMQAMRGLGLHALKGIGPLRRFVMRQGVAPEHGLPALMQSPADLTTAS